MKGHKFKKILSVVLSVAMIAGLITVSEPREADAADAGVNLLTNGDFASADSAWMDQDGTLVPAQKVEEKVTLTEYMVNGDFEASTNQWTDQGATPTITAGAGYNGTAGLVLTRTADASGNPYAYYGLSGLDTTVTYTVSFCAKAEGVTWRLYVIETGSDNWQAVGDYSVTEWDTYSYQFTTTTGNAQFGFQLIGGAGTLYVDNFSVTSESKTLAKSVINVFENGDFEASTNQWNDSGAAPTIAAGAGYNGTAGLVLTRTADASGNPYAYYGLSGLDTTVTYTVSFCAKAEGVTWRLYVIGTGSDNWQAVGDYSVTEWDTYSYQFTTTTGNAQFGFQLIGGAGSLYVDDFTVTYETVEIEAQNVFENGDFEASTNQWNDSGAAPTITAGAGYNGTAGLVLTRTADASGNPYTYYGLSGLDTTVAYTVSFRAKAEGVTWRLYVIETGSDNWQAVGDYSVTEWDTYSYQFTTTTGNAQFGFQLIGGAGTLYIDDFAVTYDTQAYEKTYTEGIGTCNNAETDNVLVMKDYTKVTQPVTITSGETYSYSFAIKGVDTGSDFAASVIAGDTTVQTISTTSEWTTVEGQFTATENATAFGFARTGEGELWIDDVVLNSTTSAPTDHTTLEGPYIPEGYTNLLSGAATDFSSSEHGHSVPSGATVQNGYLKATMAFTDTIQFGGMSAVAGQEYTFSCYIWTEGTNYCLQMYEAGTGSASGSGWYNLTYTCTADTGGWVKAEYSFTANGTGEVYIGFQQIGNGNTIVYVDDVSFTTAKPSPSDHTVQGGAYIPEGDIAVFSQDMSTNNNLNLGSLSGATVADGMLMLPFTGVNYVQTNSIDVQADTAYTLSFYAWVDGATDGFVFNIFATGAGNGWIDYATTSITGDTYGWQLVTYQFTATSASTIAFGFKNYGDAAGTVYVDDLALSTEATGEATDITLSYGANANFHYEQENRLYILSTGTTTADLTGTLTINGTEVSMTYQHYNGSLVLLFDGKLSETDVNTIEIPAGTTLYNGNAAVYNIANTFTIYTKKVADGQWMTWLSEYDYQGSDVMYYDMGTAETKYVFNNVADMTYQGVLTVTGKADIMLGGRTNASQDVTALGDYEVSRTMKGEKYDYTVALYKRGDADKTQDGGLTAKDLVASKWAVQTTEEEFGHARYKAADSNTDGMVNEEDAAFMRYILVNDYDITTTTSKGYSTLGQGVMPIVGYGGPSDDNTKQNDVANRSTLGGIDNMLDGDDGDKVFGLIKELGINVFSNAVHQVGDDYETSTRMLKQAEKYGLGIYINNTYISNASYVETQLPIQTAKYDSFASFHGYYVEDEPKNASAISNYTTQLTALKNHVNIASYFNLSPLSDSNFSTTTAYENYLKAALATGAESLQYDMYLRGKYTLWNYKIRTDEFYENLDIARTQSMNYKKPFQAWVQTGANWIDTTVDGVSSSNRLTVQEMYLEANAALAMGAKGIHYFTLVESVNQVAEGDNDSGLITIRGEANNNEGGNYAYYNAAKKINTYITTVDEVLMNATSKGVVTTNTTVKGYIGDAAIEATSDAAGVLKEITGSAEAFVGCFDYYGKDAYLVVNITPDDGTTGSEQSITLNFDKEVTYSYTFMDGTTGTATGSSATGTIAAGEAVLVVIQ